MTTLLIVAGAVLFLFSLALALKPDLAKGKSLGRKELLTGMAVGFILLAVGLLRLLGPGGPTP